MARVQRGARRAFTWDFSAFQEPDGPAQAGRRPAGTGPDWAVATEHPLAVEAAAQVLRAGGAAADAVVAGVTTHCTVCGGTSTLAGTMSGVYHDAPSRKTVAFNAGCDVPRAEAEPWDQNTFGDSGRTVLVPGVVAGLGALSERYGRYAWKDLLGAAVHVATDGFLVYPQMVSTTQRYREKLLRHPSGREVMLVDGELPKLGSRYRQPRAADTLERLAAEGWTDFYGGVWGRSLVEAVRSIGGRMSVDDLERYEVRWEEPQRGRYVGYDIAANVPPQIGGSILIGGLEIAEALETHKRPAREDAATLHDEMRALLALAGPTGFFGIEAVKLDRRAESAERRARLDRVLARDWAQAQADDVRRARAGAPPGHSHTFVCVDAQGSCAALTHTMHGDTYGRCGLVVGGVHLNGSAPTMSWYDYWPGPGGRACDSLTADLALRDGRPVLAATAIGTGLHAAQLQNHINVLGRGMAMDDSVAAPRFGSYGYVDGKPRGVLVEAFDSRVLDAVEAAGLPLSRPQRDQHSFADTGVWAAVAIDAKTGTRTAVNDPRLQGDAKGGRTVRRA